MITQSPASYGGVAHSGSPGTDKQLHGLSLPVQNVSNGRFELLLFGHETGGSQCSRTVCLDVVDDNRRRNGRVDNSVDVIGSYV